jgi:hypothetical protein
MEGHDVRNLFTLGILAGDSPPLASPSGEECFNLADILQQCADAETAVFSQKKCLLVNLLI